MTSENSVQWIWNIFLLYRHGSFTGNTPLVKFIRNWIRDLSGVFSISSLVNISMTSFPAFSRLFVFGWLFVYIIKRTLHVSPKKIRILCSCHSNTKFTSSCHRVISSIYLFIYFFFFWGGGYIFTWTDYGDLFSDEGVLWHVNFKQLVQWELQYKMSELRIRLD